MVETTQLGLRASLQTDMDSAYERVAAALKAEGFGVLTEIDVKATLKNKLDVDFHPYKILGACNPRLAHQALTAAPEVGLLLPCNVTLSQTDDETVEVAAVEPMTMLGIIHNPVLEAVAAEAHERLTRVIASLGA